MKIALSILFIFIYSGLHCQQKQIVFDHYGLDAGFNSKEAMYITSSPDGFIWVSSNDGFARYDGKRFKFYQHIPGEPNSLISNYCKAIQSDKRGRLWIISGENLEVFDPKLEKFSHLKHRINDSLKQKIYPTSFYYDELADEMWVSTKKGLYYSKNGSLQLNLAKSADSLMTETRFGSITAGPNNELWVAASNRVCKFNKSTGITTWIDIGDMLTKKFGRSLVDISSCFLDGNSVLWMGTWMGGLIEYNTVTGTLNQHFYKDPKKEGNLVGAVVQDQGDNNNLWVSTAGFGFTSFNKITHKFYSYATNETNTKGGIKGNSFGLYQDKYNTLWIGSETGLHKLDANKQIFNTLDLSSIANGVTLLPVGDMALQRPTSNREEILWIEIPYKGGYIYNVTRKQILELPKKVAKYLNPPTGVFKIYIDTKNILYIATNQYGLIAYDIEKDKIVLGEKQYFYDQGKWASYFLEDKDGNLWIGTYNGLYRKTAITFTIEEVKVVNDGLKKEGLSINIQGLCEFKDGSIWFTADNTSKPMASIGNYIPSSDKLKIIYNEKQDISVAESGVDLREIVCDDNGNLLVSNWGSGIAIFSATKSNPTLKYLTKADGINSNYINYLQKDESGNIWCSTALGLSYYKTNENSFVNYNHFSYGIENTVDAPLCFSPYSRNLYIGQHNAIRYCNTNITRLSNSENKLRLSGLSIFNMPYKNKLIDFSNHNTVRLRHLENMISIEFALLSYTNSSDNMYSWMLEGFDKTWTVSKENIASYSNLKPGTYTLYVKAADSQGEWMKTASKLVIIISPPFYKTWWFTAIWILCVLGLAYWLIQQRINRIKARYQLRNRIAANLHDEIGSTLTSISILSDVFQQAMQQHPEQALEMLQQISIQSKNIQQSMSDIVWSLRSENELIGSLASRMREYAAQTLEPLNIGIEIIVASALQEEKLPIDYRKEILLIFKEATNNIAKHANANTVKVTITKQMKNIELTVADNGHWKGTGTGTGIKSMQERALSLAGTLSIKNSVEGTELKLTVPIP